MFIKPEEITSKPDAIRAAKCGACGLYKTCLSPKMPVTGEGRLGVLVVAEAPGETEDKYNEQLIGKAGKLLRDSLSKIGVDLDRDCWKTNALICRPPNNDKPTNDQIDYCRPNLLKAVQNYNPRVVLLLGGVAVRSMIGPLWREDTGAIGQWVGWQIPLQKYNCWIVSTWHPSYLSRMENEKEGKGKVVKLWFERHLESAFLLRDRPWKEIPDYESEIDVVIDPSEAAEKLREWCQSGEPISFDYETNRLKPDHDNAEIVSCAVCRKGEETIAYPWVGDAVEATRELLISDCPKIGANCKFESRWTKRVLGVDVRNWKWDCMLSAHHLDCRPGITSVKFQAFVRLGFPAWDKVVKSYLSNTKRDGTNRIRECDLETLLKYNGIDALVEYKVAELQRKEMKEGQNGE